MVRITSFISLFVVVLFLAFKCSSDEQKIAELEDKLELSSQHATNLYEKIDDLRGKVYSQETISFKYKEEAQRCDLKRIEDIKMFLEAKKKCGYRCKDLNLDNY